MQNQFRILEIQDRDEGARDRDNRDMIDPFTFPEVQEAILEVDGQLERITNALRRICQTGATAQSPFAGESEARPQVERIIRERARRSEVLPARLFADPAWDILLELYRAQLEQYRVSTAALQLASKVPATTALRWLGILEREGLVARDHDPFDKRRVYARLTADGSAAMADYFSAASTSSGDEPCAH